MSSGVSAVTYEIHFQNGPFPTTLLVRVKVSGNGMRCRMQTRENIRNLIPKTVYASN